MNTDLHRPPRGAGEWVGVPLLPDRWLFESLEPRRLLAASPFAQLASDGMLQIKGTAAANHIWIYASGTQIVAFMDGAEIRFAKSSVKALYVDAGDGNDVVRNQASIPNAVFGAS